MTNNGSLRYYALPDRAWGFFYRSPCEAWTLNLERKILWDFLSDKETPAVQVFVNLRSVYEPRPALYNSKTSNPMELGVSYIG